MSDGLELLVIGGGPAGLSAARSYRESGGGGAVAIVSDEQRMPYNRPPLTKELLRGEMTEEELPLEAEAWLGDHAVRLISGRAVALDAEGREVTLSGGRRLTYGTCLLATGAEPKRLPVPGADDPGVRVVRSLDDVRELLHRLRGGPRAIVIGSGFIGCEIAASLRHVGHPVDLVSDESAPNTTRLGAEAAAELRRWLTEAGVKLHLGAPVESIARRDSRLRVLTAEAAIEGDVVVMATGVAPRSELASSAGLALEGGAIPVDAGMRTTLPGLLVAGDVGQAENRSAARALRVEHWGEALDQGSIAGKTAAGEPAAWDKVPGFWSMIGQRTLKQAAWGDGWEQTRFERHHGAAFTAWYGRRGRLVGVLTHERDQDYETGRTLIASGAPWSS